MPRILLSTWRTVLLFVICWLTLLWKLTPPTLLTSSLLLFSIVYLQGYKWQAYPLAVVSVLNGVHLMMHMARKEHEEWDDWIVLTSVFLECLSFTGVLFWPIPTLPHPTGRSRVATHIDSWTVFEGQEARRLTMRVWYPSAQHRKTPNARYLYALLAPTLDRVASPLAAFFPRMPPYLYSHLLATKTATIFGGKLSAQKQKYPVVLFSHDYKTVPDLYTVMLTELASRGYVVFALYHNDAHANLPLHQRRVADLSHALQRINAYDSTADVKFGFAYKNKRIELEGNVFYHRLRLQNGVALFGHGLGGLSVLAKQEKISIAAVVAIDATLGHGQVTPLSVPSLFISSALRSPSSVEKQFMQTLLASSSPPPTTLLFRNTSPLNFTDWLHLVSLPLRLIHRSSVVGSAPASRVTQCITYDLCEFLRQHLRKKTARVVHWQTT